MQKVAWLLLLMPHANRIYGPGQYAAKVWVNEERDVVKTRQRLAISMGWPSLAWC